MAPLDRWRYVRSDSTIWRMVEGKPVQLSSGQITFIQFAAHACLHIENGTMVLFDEPEIHLHPRFVTEFVRLLDQLLEYTGSQAILATHSPYVVREVTQSQVLILRVSEGRIDAIEPRLRTFGADIGAISTFVFGDPLYGSTLTDLAEKLEHEHVDPKGTLESLEDDLSGEGYMFLRRKLTSPAR